MNFARSASPALPLARWHRGVSRLWLAALAVQVTLLCLPASAQDNNPIDPPGRTARLSLAEGTISFLPAPVTGDGREVWTAAPLNRPLTAGDRLWVGPQARGELHIGSTALHLDHATSLDLLRLDDDNAQLRLGQGSLRLRVRELPPGQLLEVDTPNLAFAISQPGDYRVDVYPASNTTRVVVQQGSGLIYGAGGTSPTSPLNIGQQQQGSFTGTQLALAAPGATVQDGFDAWASHRNQQEDQSVSARYVPRSVVGYQQLDSYGDWSHDATYGNVWLPRAVPAGWAPYRSGQWSWVAPWGWTWVDQAPWGFAPFHYGRWAQIGPRWAWVPGNYLQSRPVYAPALVGFMGNNPSQTSRNQPHASAHPGLSWFPLAPGEVFHPGYHASPRYVTQINNNFITSSNNTNFSYGGNNYRYQHQPTAISSAPARPAFMPENKEPRPPRHLDGRPGRLLPAQPGQIQIQPQPPATPAAPVIPAAPPARPIMAPAQITPLPAPTTPPPPAQRPLQRPIMGQPATPHQQVQPAANTARHEQQRQQNEQARQELHQQRQNQHEARRQENLHQHEQRLRQHQQQQKTAPQ